MSVAFLQVEGLVKSYPRQRGPEAAVLENVTFSVQRGEVACVLGPSGCGKSTLFRVIAGLETADSGMVFVDGREVRGPGLDRGVVFQDHLLFPWLTVFENVAFAVRARWPRWTRDQVLDQCRKYLGLVDMLTVSDRRPAALSGGMRQRVGVARAFAIEPKILLLDEPFGALDPRTRAGLQDQLLDLCASLGQTVLVITHDVDEALLLADTIFLMGGPARGLPVRNILVGLSRARRARTLHRQSGYVALRHQLLDALWDGGDEATPAAAFASAVSTSPAEKNPEKMRGIL